MYEKNIDMRISPASLTKLMTALILFENYELAEELTVSLPSNYIYEGKVAYLKNGDKLSTEQLLEFLLVYSANDSAYVAALQVSETIEDFVLLMNKRARQLGMNGTNFSNPEGLDDNEHYTTLNDLLTLSIYIIKNTTLIDITSKNSFMFEIDNILQKYSSTNLLLKEGYSGLKTGWTSNAGLTFIGLKNEGERSILIIVNRSIVDEEKVSHFKDTKLIYENSILNFGINEIISINSPTYIQRTADKPYLFTSKDNWTIFGELNNSFQLSSQIINEQILQIKMSDSVLKNIYIEKEHIEIKYNFFKSNFISNLINK